MYNVRTWLCMCTCEYDVCVCVFTSYAVFENGIVNHSSYFSCKYHNAHRKTDQSIDSIGSGKQVNQMGFCCRLSNHITAKWKSSINKLEMKWQTLFTFTDRVRWIFYSIFTLIMQMGKATDQRNFEEVVKWMNASNAAIVIQLNGKIRLSPT